MPILDQKRNLFGKIASLNVLNEGYPILSTIDSLRSISNSLNTTDFLIDLTTSLIGFDELRNHVINTIVYDLDDIEVLIKNAIKRQLKEMVSCSVNPLIPIWLQHGNSGVTTTVPNIDFYDTMKIDPTSYAGELIYTDVSSGINSQNFDTYLYYTIQTQSTPTLWGSSTSGTDIIETTFTAVGTTQNNILKFTTSPQYSNKTLTQFNNDYVDSISLFGDPNSPNSSSLINGMMEQLFGSVGLTVGKSKSQLKKEAEINEILKRIIESETDVISNNFFEFDNPTLAELDEEVNNRKLGVRKLKNCGEVLVQITPGVLKSIQDDILLSATTKQGESIAVNKSMEKIANQVGRFPFNKKDGKTAKNNFFKDLLENFNKIILNILLSPKFVTIFAINHAILYGEVNYDGPTDFLKKNKGLIKQISNEIRDKLLGGLLKLSMKDLSQKISKKLIDDQIEKVKNHKSILLSYTGTPPNVIARIRAL